MSIVLSEDSGLNESAERENAGIVEKMSIRLAAGRSIRIRDALKRVGAKELPKLEGIGILE